MMNFNAAPKIEKKPQAAEVLQGLSPETMQSAQNITKAFETKSFENLEPSKLAKLQELAVLVRSVLLRCGGIALAIGGGIAGSPEAVYGGMAAAFAGNIIEEQISGPLPDSGFNG